MKPLQLLPIILLFASFIYGQKTDTLRIFYKSDEYTITKQDKQRLDSFLKRNWDRISINGFTDEMDTEDYNLELSKKRSQQIYQYLLGYKIDPAILFSGFFGEAMPIADNSTDDGKALNRRTEIVGYQFARITIKPKIDPTLPVTKTLNNGFIITYSPANISDWLANNFAAGSGIDFQVISNTTQMQQNNLYNNTTNGEILSSVMIICGQRLNPCKLAAPIEMKIPIPFKTKCPIEKVKFFNAVADRGKLIWQEQNKALYPETIDGVQYIKIMMD
ncbi:MAG TPA: OmpA family protein, partial [Chitinophagaceae bacterium]|nr:OmpA family protein [Chitinophagaceae bacterium]